jgi:hypothetical protein
MLNINEDLSMKKNIWLTLLCLSVAVGQNVSGSLSDSEYSNFVENLAANPVLQTVGDRDTWNRCSEHQKSWIREAFPKLDVSLASAQQNPVVRQPQPPAPLASFNVAAPVARQQSSAPAKQPNGEFGYEDAVKLVRSTSLEDIVKRRDFDTIVAAYTKDFGAVNSLTSNDMLDVASKLHAAIAIRGDANPEELSKDARRMYDNYRDDLQMQVAIRESAAEAAEDQKLRAQEEKELQAAITASAAEAAEDQKLRAQEEKELQAAIVLNKVSEDEGRKLRAQYVVDEKKAIANSLKESNWVEDPLDDGFQDKIEGVNNKSRLAEIFNSYGRAVKDNKDLLTEDKVGILEGYFEDMLERKVPEGKLFVVLKKIAQENWLDGSSGAEGRAVFNKFWAYINRQPAKNKINRKDIRSLACKFVCADSAPGFLRVISDRLDLIRKASKAEVNAFKKILPLLEGVGKNLENAEEMDELVSKVFQNVIGLDLADETIDTYVHRKTLEDVASMLKNGEDYFTREIEDHCARVTGTWNNADNHEDLREDLNKEYHAMMHTLGALKNTNANTIITKKQAEKLLSFASEKNGEFNKVRVNDNMPYYPSLD